ncbi:Hpt domain-containing protein [Pelagibius sp.]|uniref:Hpt domain-containing protein n=1 Tax=Pelagibius sp. TaxID=1931238 RepID=UPI002628C875|nr:Hpt domain-containing protein [Pelagibius sp.]
MTPAEMRAAFQADLARRVAMMERLLDQLEARSAGGAEIADALAAHLHDIKGTGRPFGVPEATDLARSFEHRLKQGGDPAALDPAVLRELLGKLKALC